MKKMELEKEKKNFEAWLNGLYVFDAFSTVVANALSKKGDKPKMYFSKPIDFNEKPETKVEKEHKEVRRKNNWGRMKERWAKNGNNKNS